MANAIKPANSHVEKFTPMVGTFSAEVLLSMGDGDPFRSTGTMVNSWDLGGTFLKQEYTGDASDGPFPRFLGRGYFGYNPTDLRYEGFWIDTGSNMMQYERGQVDGSGKCWEMQSEFTHPETKDRVRKRSVIAIHDDSRHHMETYMTLPNQSEMKVMTIHFTRRDS